MPRTRPERDREAATADVLREARQKLPLLDGVLAPLAALSDAEALGILSLALMVRLSHMTSAERRSWLSFFGDAMRVPDDA